MIFPHVKEVEDIGLKNQQNLSNNPEKGGFDPLGVECQFCLL
jgi:hypothetical protein